MHQTRTVLILAGIMLACVVALYMGGRWLRRVLERPYSANVQAQLRALVVAEESYRRDSLSYTSELARVWHPTAETQGVQLRILTASEDAFLAEGHHNGWTGRCLIALGRAAGDSLPGGEPVCH